MTIKKKKQKTLRVMHYLVDTGNDNDVIFSCSSEPKIGDRCTCRIENVTCPECIKILNEDLSK